MPEDGEHHPDDPTERVDALIAQLKTEITFDRITRIEELQQARTQLAAAILHGSPEADHGAVGQLIAGGLDRLLDALVADGRRIEVLAEWAHQTRIQNLQLRAQLIQVELRLLTVENGGTVAPDHPDAVERLLELATITRRINRLAGRQ